MTTIDIENAKQIRQPMDVIIQIAAAETATLTYSGYSAAKVADGELDEPDWPMRKLADLQGDGFLLDGSAVLYDSTVTASAADGKLGVRSVIGTGISVTVTSDVALQYLTVTASGAESVTYNGTAYSMTSGYALIPVGGGTTFTLTFTPAAADERIEISDIQPGALIRITNDNLISAVVSLRSDLSILEPTLPESEINIEAYFDEDISETLAAIPDETPITYQAGYEGDMSPVRKFYLAEQITWANNVMSIHAVDAVHLLDVDYWPVTIGIIGTRDASIRALYMAALSCLDSGGIVPDRPDGFLSRDNIEDAEFSRKISIIPKTTARELLAKIMWLFHADLPSAYTVSGAGFWPNYVDAGIPTMTWKKPVPSWEVSEEDCGDVKRMTARNIASMTVTRGVLNLPTTSYIYSTNFPSVGSCNLIKDVGASISFDDYVYDSYAFLFKDTNGGNAYPVTVRKDREDYARATYLPYKITALNSASGSGTAFGRALLIQDIPQKVFDAFSVKYYTQFVPWNSYMANMWSTIAGSSDSEISAEKVPGKKISIEEVEETYTGASSGEAVNVDGIIWHGGIYTMGTDTAQTLLNVFPTLSMQSILDRSPITGSFTWKGDPRMQPRDVFTFHRLDGTDEECTLENITITHERGGTSAEITYRCGVC